MPDWFSGIGIVWVVIAWVVVLAGAVTGAAVLLVRLPPDYFRGPERPSTHGWAWRVLRNLLGAVLLIVGLALLLLPGPGLLCVLAGVLLVDIPGRRRVERWIMGREKVRHAANWLRRKFGKEPISAPG